MGERTPLEEAAAAVAANLGIAPDAPMTGEQAAEFRERFAEAARDWQPQVIPHQPLTKDEVRRILRECVTVVKPGETLIIQVGEDWTPNQVMELGRWLNYRDDENGPLWPFRTLVVPGERLGVAEAPGVTHRCPPEGEGLMPCCGLTPFGVPRTDRLAMDDALVTCTGADRSHE